jgi:hypothetical protein
MGSKFVTLDAKLFFLGGNFLAYFQSIAYDPRTWTTKGIFYGPVLGPLGGVRSPKSIVFHMSHIILGRIF